MEQRELMNREKLVMQIMKGKRTKRTRPPPSNCSESTVMTAASPTASSTETSTEEEEDMANCLILLAQGSGINIRSTSTTKAVIKPTAATDGINNHVDVYRCKTCDKSFSSFQALGGHRTSHKKAKANDDEKLKTLSLFKADNHHETAVSLQIPHCSENHGSGKSKIHECSFCGAEFSSGQALGGHMRRHRVAASEESNKKPAGKNVLGLDLNLPAPEEPNNFVFGSKEKLLVFSPSLVDCHY